MDTDHGEVLPITDSFEFEYFDTDVRYGRGCVERLDDEFSQRGFDSALVVCGRNVGSNEKLMTPIRDALGDRLAAVFDETTPAKSAETMYDGIEVMREVDPDVVVGLGGGSSLNVARQMTVFAADGRSLAEVREAAREGRLHPPDPDPPLVPVVVVPTTFAGADLSGVGSVEVLSAEESPTGQPIRTMGSNVPVASFTDPSLFETTPFEALAGSAMNGFNKGIETIYARNSNPITHGTAIHGLRLLSEAYPRLGDENGDAMTHGDANAMDRAVVGNVLVQFRRQTSIIHAFGHAFAQRYPLQQGVVHAILAPHVLRYLLERVDARRSLLAEGLGIDTERPDAALATEIVDAVDDLRASLGLPDRLRDLDPVDASDFGALAEFVVEDSPMRRVPRDLEPTVGDVEAILDRAW